MLGMGLLMLAGTAYAGTTPSFGAVSCAAGTAETQAAPRAVAVRAVQGRGGAQVRPAAQVTRNDKADATFELRPAADGGAEVTAVSGDLRVTKTVQATGEVVLKLASGQETVNIAITNNGTTVQRGRQRVDLPRSSRSNSRIGEARRLLADSPSVLRYRALADALINADDRTPSGIAMIITDAEVGLLTGDVGAPRRIAEHLGRRGRAGTRPAGMALDCFALMETRMTEAWTDYVSCYISVSGNILENRMQELCAVRWLVQIESYWFGFLSCTGFNW